MLLLIAALTVLVTPAARAGQWQITFSGSAASTTPAFAPTFTNTASQTSSPGPFVPLTLSIGNNKCSFSGGVNSNLSMSVTATLTWVPSGPGDTTPPSVTVLETGSAVSSQYLSQPTGVSAGANDSWASDTAVTASPLGYGANSAGSHLSVVPVPAGQTSVTLTARNLSANLTYTTASNSGSPSIGVSYSVAIINAGLKVNQDLQVFAPAPTIALSATVNNPQNLTVDWIKISVDGTSYNATLSGNTGTLTWNSSQAFNASEHLITATAQVHSGNSSVLILDSTQSSGNGRAADDVIVGGIQLQSLQYGGSGVLTLRNYASANPAPTPDPAFVSVPQITWPQTGQITATTNPAGYVQGSTPSFLLTLYPLAGGAAMGNATLGVTMNVTATSNVPDPAHPGQNLTVTLKNTGTTPISFSGGSVTVTADNPLLSEVALYTASFNSLVLWVEFTQTGQTPNPCQQISSYASASSTFGNPLYATLATPTAPMAQPWAGVLNYACQWATGTTDATSAATAVCNGFYGGSTYNPNHIWYTLSTAPETFKLQSFLQGTLNSQFGGSGLQGQCNDFSDFLTCLSNALGAVALQSQQSNGGFYYSNVYFAPGSGGVQSGSFAYHQWTTDGNVFDSAIRPSQAPVSSPVNEALSAYLGFLAPVPPNLQALTAQSPFTPQISN